MPFCTECGHRNPEGAKFCAQCGTRLVAVEAPAPVAAPEPEPAEETSTAVDSTDGGAESADSESAEGDSDESDSDEAAADDAGSDDAEAAAESDPIADAWNDTPAEQPWTDEADDVASDEAGDSVFADGALDVDDADGWSQDGADGAEEADEADAADSAESAPVDDFWGTPVTAEEIADQSPADAAHESADESSDESVDDAPAEEVVDEAAAEEVPDNESTATVTFGSATETTAVTDAIAADDDAVNALPDGSALLVVQRGPGAGNRFLLDSDLVTAGRHPESEIFLDDITVSRRHVEFNRTDEGYTVGDVGSLNGTYVNRDRITDPTLLRNGDEVQIGKFRLVYFVGSVPEEA